MKESDLKKIEVFILNYQQENFYIQSLKTIFNNLLNSKVINNYSFQLNSSKFEIEFEIEDSLLRFELQKDYFYMQIDSIEQYFWAERNLKVEIIINDLFSGNYIIKHYLNKKGKIKFLKLVWNKKNLKEYNVKYKYQVFNCNINIFKVTLKRGINLL